MYIFHPLGGLANRMRVIDSAVNYCSTNKKKFRVVWLKDTALNCSFTTIWKPFKELQDERSKWLPLFFKLRRRKKMFIKFLQILDRFNFLKVYSEDEYELFREDTRTNKLLRYRHCILASYSTFSPSPEFRTDLFQLQAEIGKKVNVETSQFNSHTIGVHIRRTDNIDSIQNSPLELFEKNMAKEIEKESSTQFYVASDSQEVKDTLKETFGDRIILPQGILNRDSTEGIIQAVVEMYALSRTKKIMGSFFSSFSDLASLLGRKELHIIKK